MNTIKIIFTQEKDIEQISEMVYALFTSPDKNTLAPYVSDYWIDQILMKVNAISNQLFGVEKQELRKLVNKAKQLSIARNKLIGGNFEILSHWFLGTQATIISNSPLFQGDFLYLQPTNGLLSSYAFQKIDESQLKPYTRYTVSGFIANSQGLELIISRYGKEIQTILQVPFETSFPINSNPTSNCCQPNICTCDSCKYIDSHFFNYSIDVGSLYPELNPGIEFGLRIIEPNGNAKISNLEIKEEGLLNETEKRQVQRKEQKWKERTEQEYTNIYNIFEPLIYKINSYFPEDNWNDTILPHVTYQDLYDIILPEIPTIKHWFMNNRANIYYHVLQPFKEVIQRIKEQLEIQNLLHNGDFSNGLTNWNISGQARLINLENKNQALHLSYWDSIVSQTVTIVDFNEDAFYKIRVYAKGNGTVLVQHDGKTETISITQDQFQLEERTFYFDSPTFIINIQSDENDFTVDSVEIIEIVA